MEDKEKEVVFVVVGAICFIALVGGAALWLGSQSMNLGYNGTDPNATAHPPGSTSLFATPDTSSQAEKVPLHGKITLSGQVPELTCQTTSSGASFEGRIQLNYAQDQNSLKLTGGDPDALGLIDTSGNYTVEDVYQGVPFSATVTLFTSDTAKPVVIQVPGSGDNDMQAALNGPGTRDYSLNV